MNFFPSFLPAKLVFMVVLLAPSLALAQSGSIQAYISAFTNFINNTLIPFLFAVAILFLLFNITRYFIIEGADSSSREAAKKYVLYAIAALVVLTSIWGIINLVSQSLGIDNHPAICPDYVEDCANSGYGGGGYDYY